MAGTGSLTGKTFNNRYELGELIGVGGMAEVYIAQDMVLGRNVAVKTMLPQYAQDPDFTRRFRQEAAAAANLQSPYIVNVYDWGHDQGTYYIVMEFVRGSDLKTAIIERGAINQRKVAEIGSQVCQALTVAHQQDIIHRDIKPQNIMIQPDGNVKVMDFGIARAKNSTADKTQAVLGTAHYTSPEQAQGKDLTAASDIYSLGVVMYEAATGKLPFDGPDAVSVALMQVQDTPLPPRQVNPSIDPDFEAIIMTAMAKDPAARFATANDMRLALNDFLAGRPLNLAPLIAGAAVGAAGVAVGAAAANGFTNARTSVMQPAGGVGTTQVMPAAGGANGANGQRRVNGVEPEKKKSKKGPVIAVVVILVIAAIAGCAFFFNSCSGKSVPDVVGMTSQEAVDAIQSAGYSVGKIENTYDSSVEAGKVVSQSPKGGSQAEKGTKINIVVSQGSEQVEVPNVVGLPDAEARATLSAAGFTVGDVSKQYSDKVDEGCVISQDPASGRKANKGSVIKLVISQGVEQVEVPDLTGMSASQASSAARAVGLNITQSGSQYSSSVPKGCIISTNPGPGSTVDKGSTISYIISDGPETSMVTVPNVVGKDVATATNTLQGAGFNVTVSPSGASGNVDWQSPVGGNQVEYGSSVTIHVSGSSGGGGGGN